MNFHSSYAVSKTLTESETSGLKNPVSKDKRVIVLHAAGEHGLIPKGLMFESGRKTVREKAMEVRAVSMTAKGSDADCPGSFEH
ncbi:hypothetical protein J6590_072718 [Homalodisca vitripennis]|nr:hypothetical protein J6590_072718 [Homalodisca vitripennis]